MKKIKEKRMWVIIVMVFLGMSCGTSSNAKDVYTITKVQPEKDGQTLFLKNGHGDVFTTVISIPNGNFIKVTEGDRVTLDIEEVLDMDPPIIISKKVTLVQVE